MNIENLMSSLAGAFFGSLTAYWLSCREQDKREVAEQLRFVTYAVSALSHIVSQLYVIKKNIVLPRLLDLENAKSGTTIKLEELMKFIQTAGMTSPIKGEQASFLAQEDPNVIYLIDSLSSAISRLSQIIYDYNNYLSQVVHAGTTINLNLLNDYIHNLADQTNETLYLSAKSQEVLIMFGEFKFKKSFKIKSVDVEDEWKGLAPPKIATWESVEWFSKNRK